MDFFYILNHILNLGEGIDGVAFTLLDLADLKEMGLNMGSRKKINDLIEKTKFKEVTLNVMNAEDIVFNEIRVLDRPISPQPGSSREESSQPGPSQCASPKAKSLGFTVREALCASEDGQSVLNTLDGGAKRLEPQERKLLVRIVTQRLIVSAGNQYPKPSDKEELARAIVSEFPALRATPRPGTEGHEHFYHNYSGFLENRFKSLHKKLTPKKRKYKPRRKTAKALAARSTDLSSSSKGSDEDDPTSQGSRGSTSKASLDEQVAWMRHTVPNNSNREKIAKALSDTFHPRRRSIKKDALTITAILSQYPRLLAFQGNMIDEEFTRVKPESSEMAGRFVTHYKPRIIEFGKITGVKKPESLRTLDNDNIEALVLLATMLPSTNVRRKNLMVDKHSNCLFTFVPPGIDIAQFAIDKKTEFSQPHIICAGTPRELGPFFILLDHQLLDVGSCPLRAVDILVKTHYVFNVSFCAALSAFCNFVEVFLLKLDERALAIVTELEAALTTSL